MGDNSLSNFARVDVIFSSRPRPAADRFQAAGIALPLRAIAGLAKVQESGSAGGEASGGRGLGSLIITTRERRGLR